MKRRKFFKNASLSIFGAAIPFQGELVSFNDDLIAAAIPCTQVNDRVLVIVRLQGANDGLNTFIPDNQYSLYKDLRPKIKIPRDRLKPLDNTTGKRNVLLNPAMNKFKSHYERGDMSLVHAVGYKNYNYSHFSSDQVLWKGSDANANFKDGMLARYISKAYKVEENKGIKSKNKGKNYLDPYAIQLGNPAPIASFRLDNGTSFEYNGSDFLSDKLKTLNSTSADINALVDSRSEYRRLLEVIRDKEGNADQFIKTLQWRFSDGKNSSVNYEKGALSSQLRMVARLIKGESKTKIYQCTLGGFDTHSAQVDLSNTTQGTHANLLNQVSSAIDSFMKDLKALKIDKKVLLMSYSEFGRTVTDNGSGTDHGNLNPVFLIGSGVKAGIIGDHPNLKNIDNLGRFKEEETQFNFKDIYANVLRDWLGASDAVIRQAIGSPNFGKKIKLIDAKQVAKQGCSLDKVSALETSDESLFTSESASETPVLEYTVYPNPASRTIYIKASDSSLKGKIQTTLYDQGGHMIYSQAYDLGSNSGIDLSPFPSGLYILKTDDPLFGSSTHKIIKE